jgi:predicted MPP superfamily phosphohydrolase
LVAVALVAAAAWGLFESQWVERRRVNVRLPGLPPAADGLRVLHLSDLHLGTVSFSERAVRKAVAWAEAEPPDLVVVTGDLVTRARGLGALEDMLARLAAVAPVVCILGNHDVDDSRDPFRHPPDFSGVDLPILRDEERMVGSVHVVGVDPSAYRAGTSKPAERADPGADVRILLCHYPEVVRRLPPGVFELVLAGHYHGGQLCLPSPWGKLRLKDFRAPYWKGLHETAAGWLHVSRGLGTSFVPFRFLARPEATMLTLRAAD